MDIPSSVNLTKSSSQQNFIVNAKNYIILEDYEEYFTISISLDNLNVLASIDTSAVVVTIRDNEGTSSSLARDSCIK